MGDSRLLLGRVVKKCKKCFETKWGIRGFCLEGLSKNARNALRQNGGFVPFALEGCQKCKKCFETKWGIRGFCLEGLSKNARNALRRNGGFAAFAWKGHASTAESSIYRGAT
jgi:hypothetical protein